MKPQNTFEIIYKIVVVFGLIYIGYELNSIKKLALANEKEINFVTSKLDYVTSDINLPKIND